MSYDELPPEWEGQAQLVDASTGWMPLDFKKMEEARRSGYPAADYFGVYAVENKQVASAVRVLRIPYTMGDGTVEIVSGIQGVVTRRESSRNGFARQLLSEVHEREADAGSKLVILQTGFGNTAHNLYLSMGYVDVFTPKLALRRLPSGKKRVTGYKVVTAKAGDAELIGKIHAEATKGRVGFTPRPRGYPKTLFKLGLAKPGSLRLILRGQKPVAYFQVQKGLGWVSSGEVVLGPGIRPEVALSVLESEAPDAWLSISGTFASDAQSLLG